jgi:hypothetical protein
MYFAALRFGGVFHFAALREMGTGNTFFYGACTLFFACPGFLRRNQLC